MPGHCAGLFSNSLENVLVITSIYADAEILTGNSFKAAAIR